MAARVISIGIEQLPAELKRGERQFRAAFVRGLRRGAERGRAIIVRKTPTDQGQLRASWKVKGHELAVELINDAPHAGLVELGSRPHNVNPEGWAAIYEWVRRHPQLYGESRARSRLGRDSSGRFTSTRRPAVQAPFRGIDPQITAITNGIVRKLATKGQEATFFVLKNVDALREAMIEEVERQLARATESRGDR